MGSLAKDARKIKVQSNMVLLVNRNTHFWRPVMIFKLLLKRITGGFAVAAALAPFATAPFAAAQNAEAPSMRAATVAATPLDYEFFKTRVQPIFLKKRSPDHAR